MNQTPPVLDLILELRGAQSLPGCRYHDSHKAVSFCASCGVPICESCHRADAEGLAHCPVCLQRQSMQEALERSQRHAEMVELDAASRQRLAQDARPEPKPTQDEAPAPPPSLRAPAQSTPDYEPVPWEDPSQGNLAARFFSTARLAVLVPGLLYPRAEPSPQWLRPLVFSYLCVVTGALVQLLWLFLLGEPEKVLQLSQMQEAANETGLPMVALQVMLVALVPVGALFQLGLNIGLLHLAARLVGGQGTPLKSLQLYSWSSASYLLHLIPYLGGFMAPMALVFSQLEGMRVLHKLTMGRALLAVVIPVASSLLLGLGLM